MAKLIVLALTFAAFLVFASAHRTTVTTTIDDAVGPRSSQQDCSQKVQQKEFNQCQQYMMDSPSSYDQMEMCCQELKNVDNQCQCEAVQHVFRQAQKQQGGRMHGSTDWMKIKAEMLPNQCHLKTRQCQMRSVQPRMGMQDYCSQEVEERQFNQCQKYMLDSPSSYDDMEMCCQELKKVDDQCECEAVQQVFNQAQRQQRGGRMHGSTDWMKMKAQMLPNQCNLHTKQCQIRTHMTTVDNRRGSQGCSREEISQQIQRSPWMINQCLGYIARQSSMNNIIMSVNRGSQEGLSECCEVMQNMGEECQCEALNEVYRIAEMMQEQPWGRHGGRQQRQGQQMEKMKRVLENLPQQCNMGMKEQCRIPSAMF